MDFELPDSHRALQQLPARVLRERRSSRSPATWDRARALPHGGGARAGPARRAGHSRLRGVRRRRDGRPGGGRGGGGGRPLRRLAGAHGGLPQRPGHQPHPRLRQRRAEAEVPAQARHRRVAGRLGADRARQRLRRRRHATTAVRKGDDWVLNGTKMFITQGTVGDVFVVLALTGRGAASRRASPPSSWRRGCKGFTQRSIHGKLGMRSSDTAELTSRTWGCRTRRAWARWTTASSTR